MERLTYRVNEVAKMLGISQSKVYEMIARGVIPSVRAGGTILIPVEKLREWLASPAA